ncbi:hypothetical protein [Pedobacter frigoris]|uniref:Uncharacterized protein n=1 Tax=Pedobacter frigoris TaxID=2571272 RepID=A0A4U1CGK8_9SPHI|nr:hypothetical protein [Pedobacter frigoris]TKC06298.1 hypothetical protein FA047_13365 [Pedobacter frigoris]
MELDELKSDWKNIPIPDKTKEQFSVMLKENNHPVLKGIRKQLVIEIAGWTAFLICYYSMFDGDQKPLIINLILIVSILISMIHNVSGYNFARYLVDGESMLSSLENYFSKVKWFAILSVTFRIMFAIGLLSFFSYNIRFGPEKYLLVAIVIFMFLIQIFIHRRIWLRRLRLLRQTIEDFGDEK